MKDWPTTRAEAKAANAPYYFTGKPCKFGHVDVRATKNKRCRACNRMHVKNYVAANPDRKRAVDSAYYAENAAKIIERAVRYGRDWRAANRGKARAIVRKYRATKLQRTPAWADLRAIRDFYEACPEGYEVDHIIPLQGKLVSGLHVLNNLQYLTIHQNRRKLNKFNLEEFNDDPNYK